MPLFLVGSLELGYPRSSPTSTSSRVHATAEDLDHERLTLVKNICGDVFEAPPIGTYGLSFANNSGVYIANRPGGLVFSDLARRIRAELDKRMGSRWDA